MEPMQTIVLPDKHTDFQSFASFDPRRWQPFDWELPVELEAGEPPEARGLARDEVRLLVSSASENRIEHAHFRDLPSLLQPGDLLIINTSGTLNAALQAERQDGSVLELHLSTHLPADLWIVELRRQSANGTLPFSDLRPGDRLSLAAGGTATIHLPYQHGSDATAPPRLWIASLDLPLLLQTYLLEYGAPIRYNYVKQSWPGSYYQTVYTTEMGSAEMPSAGRAFTAELITRLVATGIGVAPLLLHTGVASLEAHEPPYEEYYRVPTATARLVNAAHANGQRVIAVGTTVVRALETVTDAGGTAHPGEGWTRLVISHDRKMRAVDGLITGLHEPRATHLAMLVALVGSEHVAACYQQALAERYLWHEFGDLHLLLP
ncbi:MAG: S-adenosylmethionine:tRNA ribosyltransferase-isomerase [Herpetosiphon sp.]